MARSNLVTLIVAGGRGSRAGEGLPKQYRRVGGEIVLRKTIQAFLPFGEVRVVIHQDDVTFYQKAVEGLSLLAPAFGGDTRQESVYQGLLGLACEKVLIHDAARPFVSAQLIQKAIDALKTYPAALPFLPLTDSVKTRDGQHVERETLALVQTPQAFHYAKIFAAHEAKRGANLSDDAAVYGGDIHLFEGETSNIKLTYEKDFQMQKLRVGQGYDVHAFGEGDHVMLGGVRVPHTQGVLAHSDGDVVLHALTDAVLGVLGDGDIGTHFPPAQAQWRGAASTQFLEHALKLLSQRGGVLNHVDVTLVCETPKISPFRAQIQSNIAKICGLSPQDVGLKATTSEKMGFTGRKEGLAALAVVSVLL